MSANNNGIVFSRIQRQIKRNIMQAQTDMGEDVNRFVQKNFVNEGFHDDGLKKWRKLSKRYKAKKDKDGTNRGILIKSGDMRKSFGILRRSRNSFTFGSLVEYADKHNSGKGALPRRRMLGDSKDLRKSLTKTIERHLLRGI